MTISTFYPTGDNDDMTLRAPEYAASQSWDFVRDHAGWNNSENTISTAFISYGTEGASNIGWDRMHRTQILFDTSSIPDGDDLNSAYLGLLFYEGEASAGAYGEGANWSESQRSIVVTAGSTASDTAVVTGDYDAIKGATKWSAGFVSTKDSTASTSTSGAWNDNAYAQIDLNATGVAAVNKTGVSKLAVQCLADVDDDEPTTSGTSQQHVLMIWSAANTSGTSSDPKLVVNHGSLFTPSIRFF
jgi:hypothetical protein